MDQTQLATILSDLSLGGVRYFDRVGSTNDEAVHWAAQGAPALSLVVADEQTDGRGRAGRHWYTPRGAALAFSIVVYPTTEESENLSRMTALGALAVCVALKNRYDISAKIKWPNDVLVDEKKVAGVLVEVQWNGDRLSSMILGVGINVAPGSIEAIHPGRSGLHYQAACLESVLGRPVDRLELLHAVLEGFLYWQPRLAFQEFLQAWESRLAFRDEWVQVISDGKLGPAPNNGTTLSPIQEGQVLGLEKNGSLKLRTRSGEIVALQIGEVRLRPAMKTSAEEVSDVRRFTSTSQ